ncbi:MAG: molybdopterin molybdotransferase MoeA [Ferruginibacter sp.]|nr:molybdopterin molybdotransferase MoeA [Ferruginibacter sp.]
MVSVEEAKKIVVDNVPASKAILLPLQQAAGLVVAQDVYATIDIPAFEQSSMDGYAIRFQDKEMPLKVTGEMAAGTPQQLQLQAGEAVRIFTGAPLPQGADTVVMQEKVNLQNGLLVIKDATLKHGSNVRNKGAEIKAGSLAIPQGCYLSPAAIGFLAGIGIVHVMVYPMPTVTIILTGKELQTPGNQLLTGQVYESNSYSLTAALQQAGIKNILVHQVDDDLTIVKNKLDIALANSDIILLTGGVSVGDYDFVVPATRLCAISQHFHKVKQKPGKPLFFGTKNNTLVFGLPGNPSAVLSCFYNYVLPAIELFAHKKSSVQKVEGRLAKDYPKPKGLTQFLKGAYSNATAMPLSAQESFQLSSFAQADCLICLEEAHGDYLAGELVQVLLLPR